VALDLISFFKKLENNTSGMYWENY